MNKQVLSLPLDLIEVGQRLRPVDHDYVAMIAESMGARGQDTPVHVGVASPEGRHRLIAGAHRVAAARLLGWTKISALIFEGTDLEAELLQIDENLIRRELNDLDRAVFLARRKEIWEELHPETRHGGAREAGQDANLATRETQRFTRAAAAKLGISERTIARAVRRVARIAPDLRERLATTRLADRGGELDALTQWGDADQRAIVREMLDAEEPARSVRDAALRLGLIEDPRPDPATQQLQALLLAWRKAGKKARRQFTDHLVADGALKGDGA